MKPARESRYAELDEGTSFVSGPSSSYCTGQLLTLLSLPLLKNIKNNPSEGNPDSSGCEKGPEGKVALSQISLCDQYPRSWGH